MKTKLLLALTSFLLLASHAHAAINSDMDSAIKSLGASNAEEVSFDEGTANLSAATQDNLRQFVKEAKQNGTIRQIKVVAWADREYPVKGTEAPKADVQLANARLKAVKTFLEKEEHVKDVKGYNMAERPNGLEQWLKSSQASVKDTMENTGAAPRTNEETGLFGQKAQASKAVLMAFVKKM